MSKEALDELRATEYEIFKENQSKLPEDRRMSRKPWCEEKKDGYTCTLKKGHAGKHAAHGVLGLIHYEW